MRDAALAEASLAAVEIPLRYAQRGLGMAQLALAGAPRFETWRHYPAGDLRDPAHGTQCYYHAHGSRRSHPQEHGHFHLFVRAADGHGFHHLAALSLDALGRPLRWFTTNRWVTGERYVEAARLLPALEGFRLHARGRLAPLARWLQALVQLHRPQLAALLHRRDIMLARSAARQGWEASFEDRRLDVLSQAAIDLPARIARVAQGGA